MGRVENAEVPDGPKWAAGERWEGWGVAGVGEKC